MSRRTVRRVTAAAVLALALLFAGPGTAAAGSLEVAVPAFQGSSLLDRFLDWLDGFWDNQAAASDKSTLVSGDPNSGTNSSTPTGSTSTTRGGGGPGGEQGAMIDPDG